MDSEGYIYHNLSNQSGKFDINGNLVATYDHPGHGLNPTVYPSISHDEAYVLIKNSLIEIDFSSGIEIDDGLISTGERYYGIFSNDNLPIISGELYGNDELWLNKYSISGSLQWDEMVGSVDYYYYPTNTYADNIVCSNLYQYTGGGYMTGTMI
jgi:hypothetical protein